MSESRVFAPELSPGEYVGSHNPQGWIIISDPRLHGEVIIISSKKYRDPLMRQFSIDRANVAGMIVSNDFGHRESIPEEVLSGVVGLQLFEARLNKLGVGGGHVLFYCRHGVNRSPVAAAIYLIKRGFSLDEATDIIETTYRAQRDAKFRLNKREHYTDVLEVCEKKYHLSRSRSLVTY